MITIDRFHKHQKGSLYGWIDIRVPAWNTMLLIQGVSVFYRGDKPSFALPSRPYQDDAGETKYAPIIKIDSDDVFKRMMTAIGEAWDKYKVEHLDSTPTRYEPELALDEAPF